MPTLNIKICRGKGVAYSTIRYARHRRPAAVSRCYVSADGWSLSGHADLDAATLMERFAAHGKRAQIKHLSLSFSRECRDSALLEECARRFAAEALHAKRWMAIEHIDTDNLHVHLIPVNESEDGGPIQADLVDLAAWKQMHWCNVPGVTSSAAIWSDDPSKPRFRRAPYLFFAVTYGHAAAIRLAPYLAPKYDQLGHLKSLKWRNYTISMKALSLVRTDLATGKYAVGLARRSEAFQQQLEGEQVQQRLLEIQEAEAYRAWRARLLVQRVTVYAEAGIPQEGSVESQDVALEPGPKAAEDVDPEARGIILAAEPIIPLEIAVDLIAQPSKTAAETNTPPLKTSVRPLLSDPVPIETPAVFDANAPEPQNLSTGPLIGDGEADTGPTPIDVSLAEDHPRMPASHVAMVEKSRRNLWVWSPSPKRNPNPR